MKMRRGSTPLIFYVFLVIGFSSLAVFGQNVQYTVDSGATCQVYQGGKCDGLLENPNSIYVASGTNQTAMAKTLETVWTAVNAIGSSSCISDSNTFVTLCSLVFPGCQVGNSTTVSLPVNTCYSNCASSMTLCDPNGVFASYFSCSNSNANGPLYPNGNEQFNLTNYGGSAAYTIDCFDPQKIQATVDPSLTGCPAPLIQRISDDRAQDEKNGYTFVTANSTCVVSCPAPIFTEGEWDNLFRLNDSLTIMSLFLTLFLVFTYVILNQEKTDYDIQFSIFISGVFLMSLGGAIVSFAGRKALCPEPGRIAVNTDATCVASGFLFQFGSVLAILWFAILSFELWWTITHVKRPLKLMKYYVPVTLGITILLSCIPFAGKGYEYGVANIMCWIRDYSGSSAYGNGCFWIPLGIVISLGTIFILLIIYNIYKIVRANGRSGFLTLQLKPILMIVLIYFSFVYIFVFEFYIHDQTDNYYSHLSDFFDCLVDSTRTEACVVKGPNITYYGSYIYFLRIFGIYCFIIYGLSHKCLMIWKKSILFNNSFVSFFTSRFSSTTNNNNNSTTQNSGTSRGNNNNISMKSIGIESGIGNSGTDSANYYDDVGEGDEAHFVK